MKKILLSAAVLAVATSGAFAADLPSRKGPAVAPIAYAPVFTWTGFYAGVNAGWRFGDNKTDFAYSAGAPVGTLLPTTLKTSRDGFTGGAQAGYNYQVGQFVLGAEADINYVGGKKTGTYAGTLGGTTSYVAAESNGEWLGTARARIGFAADRLLVFATGGLAFGEVKNSASIAYTGGSTAAWSGSKSDTKAGWAAGAGVEYAITNNLTTKVEYLYYDLGDQKTVLSGNTAAGTATAITKTSTNGNLVRGGLNYKF